VADQADQRDRQTGDDAWQRFRNQHPSIAAPRSGRDRLRAVRFRPDGR
jgi:hypothetical protein